MSTVNPAIPPEHLQAIGEIVVNFAMLENWIDLCIWKLIDDKDQFLGQIVTAELSFRARVNLLSSALRHRIPDTDQVAKFDALLKRAFEVEVDRNVIVHSTWSSGDTPETITRRKTTARYEKGLRQQDVKYTVADLNLIADEIFNVISDLRAFYHHKLNA